MVAFHLRRHRARPGDIAAALISRLEWNEMTTALDDDRPYWDAKLETQSRADWDRAQARRCCRSTSPTPTPARRPIAPRSTPPRCSPDQIKTLDDIRRFPFIDKRTLRDRQLAVPPFGDLVAVPERDIVYISASSGSTGVPTASPFTAQDFDDWIDYEARQFWSSGMRPTDRYVHSLNFSLFIGGPCVLGAQKLGALTIHAGTLPSERLLQIIQQFQATVIWTTPSYAWYLGETAHQGRLRPAQGSRRAPHLRRRRAGRLDPGDARPHRAAVGRVGLRLLRPVRHLRLLRRHVRSRRTACTGPRTTSWSK